MLKSKELERYDRQLRIFGEHGQERLKNSKIFIAGAGGLGSPISIYMAVAGVGQIRIVDDDIVESSNLNRQTLYEEKDIGGRKAESAEKRLKEINPDIEAEGISETIDENNVFELVDDADLIIDAMDNFPTRYLLNRTALVKNIPFFHGAIYGFEGRVTTIVPGKTACLRCIFPETPPSETFPVIGVTPGVIGLVQATEAIKYITGVGELLVGKLLIWDGLRSSFGELAVERDPKCKDCGKHWM